MKTKRRGFTLIETITTLFIVSLLAMLVIPNVAHIREMASKRQTDAMMNMIQGQISLYFEGTHTDHVNYSELIKTGYLTEAQVDSAEKKKIIIANGQVELEGQK